MFEDLMKTGLWRSSQLQVFLCECIYHFLLHSVFLSNRACHPRVMKPLQASELAHGSSAVSPPRKLVSRVFSERPSHCHCSTSC